MLSDVTAFFSYAHIDDESTHGRLRRLSEDIRTQYMSMSGLQVDMFFDIESIPLGEQWLQRIESGLARSTFLFSIVSPAYLRSLPCRDEIRTFITLTGGVERRTIIPLLLHPMNEIDRRFPNDDLWVEIKRLQCRPIHDLRAAEVGSREWMLTTIAITDRMDEIVGPLTAITSEAESTTPSDTDLSAASDSDETNADFPTPAGTLELIASSEEAMPKLSELSEKFGDYVKSVGDEMKRATPRAARAVSFKEKLAATNSLARNLAPIVQSARETSKEMQELVAQVGPGTSALLRMIAGYTPRERHDPEIRRYIVTIETLIEGIRESAQGSETFFQSLDGSKGFSRELDKTLIVMQEALFFMFDLNATAQAWQEIIDSFDEH